MIEAVDDAMKLAEAKFEAASEAVVQARRLRDEASAGCRRLAKVRSLLLIANSRLRLSVSQLGSPLELIPDGGSFLHPEVSLTESEVAEVEAAVQAALAGIARRWAVSLGVRVDPEAKETTSD